MSALDHHGRRPERPDRQWLRPGGEEPLEGLRPQGRPHPRQRARRPAPAELRERTGCTAAVRDVSFDVEKGEVFVVMGLSGSGKSTLVRCLTRLIEPTAGTFAVDGEDVLARGTPGCANCAATAPRWSSSTRPVPAPAGDRQRGLWPGDAGDEPERGTRPGRGMSRRSAWRARRAAAPPSCPAASTSAWAWPARSRSTPKVLLFDEPFSALDPLIRREMQEEVVRLHREEGRTIVFITHDLAEALKLGDRIPDHARRPGGAAGHPGGDRRQPGRRLRTTSYVRDVPRSHVLTLQVGDARAPAGRLHRGAR